MTTQQVINELKNAGSEQTKKMLIKHGSQEPLFGVKIEFMKQIQKKVKENKQQIALELFASGIGDAQYMAGLMADGGQMTKKDLQTWAKASQAPMITEYTVPWVTAENAEGIELALAWIDDKKPSIACSGWNTLSSIVATWPDEKLDIGVLKKLLARVEKTIDAAPNRVRYCMNGFVIALGSYVKELTAAAMATGKKIGNVEVDMNGTSCKVPSAPDYIQKTIAKGYKKKKTAKC